MKTFKTIALSLSILATSAALSVANAGPYDKLEKILDETRATYLQINKVDRPLWGLLDSLAQEGANAPVGLANSKEQPLVTVLQQYYLIYGEGNAPKELVEKATLAHATRQASLDCFGPMTNKNHSVALMEKTLNLLKQGRLVKPVGYPNQEDYRYLFEGNLVDNLEIVFKIAKAEVENNYLADYTPSQVSNLCEKITNFEGAEDAFIVMYPVQ